MTVTMSQAAADGLSAIGMGDFAAVETAERMTWVVLVLLHVPDHDAWFPRGKWATIQSLQQQLTGCAMRRAQEVTP